MVGFRWSIRLLLCVAVASGGCTGPIPGLQPRPPADALVGRAAETPQGNPDLLGPTLNAPGSSRTTSGQEGVNLPAAAARSFSSTEDLDQARLDTLLEQLGAIDPVKRRQLEEQIAKSPTARTYALQLLPSYLQGLPGRPVQTANPRAEIESLLQPVEVRPVARADTTAAYAGSAADYARTQQKFESLAAHAASSSPPPLGGRPVFTAPHFNPSQDPVAVGPPSSTDSRAQSGRQSPHASYDTGYGGSDPYRPETHSTLLAGQQPAGIASTETAGLGVTAVSFEDSSGSPSLSDSPSPDSWRNHLASTIRDYEAQLRDEPESKDELDRHVADHARLRLLYLAADSRDCARDIPAASPAEQDFWKDQLFGLRTLLDTEGHPDSRYRNAVGAGHLESALERLTQMSKLLVEHTTFIRGVESWGVYEPFPSTDFAPGTRVMIYAEIKNFFSHETEKGHETKLRGGYEIFVRHGGQSMVEHDFGVVSETCRNRRHDYYVYYVFTLPSSLNPGKYTLRLTINDLHGGSVAQQDVEFSISAGE